MWKRVAVGLGIAAVAACGSSSGGASTVAKPIPPSHSPTPTALTISGDLVLSGDTDSVSGVGDSCSGTGGYDDIDQGTSATLYNEAGTILADGQLSAGSLDVGGTRLTCTFFFVFTKVPPGASFYSVEVSHRGKITDSASELKAAKYMFQLTLGS